MRLVKIIIATPNDAVIANSRIIPISIESNVRKPTVSDNKATPPGINNKRKLICAASLEVDPFATSFVTELIICTP